MLYSLHILLIPAILVGLFTAHIVLVMVHKHTQYPGPGRTNTNVVGFPFMPVYVAKAGGFFFIVFGVLAVISGLIMINPIWVYGPYDPSIVTAGSQPDWYMGFADGALRLLPGWLEFELFGFTWSFNVFIGAIALIPVLYTLLGAYPFLERWVTGDKREHHVLDRPRNAPTRTAIGAMAISFYLILFFAAGNDIMAIKLSLSINDITIFFRAAIILIPPLVFWVTKRICLSLQRHDRNKVLHGRETGTIMRTAEGKFYEVHEDIDEFERWALVAYESPEPVALAAGTDANGVARRHARKDRMRARLSHFYFKDRVEPVTPAELAAAHHHGEHEAIEAPQASGAGTHAGVKQAPEGD
jgi:ubiquinol-cytochrome c reductase cytochrome b subunit